MSLLQGREEPLPGRRVKEIKRLRFVDQFEAQLPRPCVEIARSYAAMLPRPDR
jgi:hypothetical protein